MTYSINTLVKVAKMHFKISAIHYLYRNIIWVPKVKGWRGNSQHNYKTYLQTAQAMKAYCMSSKTFPPWKSINVQARWLGAALSLYFFYNFSNRLLEKLGQFLSYNNWGFLKGGSAPLKKNFCMPMQIINVCHDEKPPMMQ